MAPESFSGDEVAALVRATSGDWSGATLVEHVREAFSVLKKVVPYDALAAYVVPTTSAAVPLCSESIDDGSMLDYPRHYRQFDPMAAGFGDAQTPVATLASAAREQGMSLRGSVFLNEFLIPRLGILNILGTNMMIAPDAALAVSIHRRKGLPDFSERDVFAMRLAVAGLSRAFSLTFSSRRALERLAEAPAATAQEDSGLAIYDESLALLHATASARKILLRLDAAGDFESLLEVGRRLLKKLRDDPALSFADATVVRKLSGGAAIVRLSAARFEPAADLRLEMLLDLVPSVVDVPLERLAAPYGLTARELDVLRLLHSGRNQVQIGLELGIAPTSVREHLVNVRRKVGAATNEQILPRLLGLS